MALQIQAIRGMNDLLPDQSSQWQEVERVLKQCVGSFGYSEIRMPILENTALFSRAIGEVTDVVEKEMYTFTDRSGDSLSLRPEGTAGCVRACLEHNLCYNQEQRLWYMGPMFRHERPQKGRYRQFHQLGVEVFGLEGPDIDAEIIMLSYSIWKKFNIQDKLTLQINTLGSTEERANYKKSLVEFLMANYELLDEDSKRRCKTNPLRVLDSKDPNVQKLLQNAPMLMDFLGEKSKEHFLGLQKILKAVGIKYEINPKLVRGLDYYNLTVFEWVTDALGSQGTVCGGGRYDGLIAQLGGNSTCAVGFGLGIERFVLLLQTLNVLKGSNPVDIYVMGSADDIAGYNAKIAMMLRENLPQCRIMCHHGGGNFKKQFKKADKLNAKVAIVIGDEEIANNTLTIKHLQNEAIGQKTLELRQAIEYIKDILEK